ncbi:MAG: VOC family protein [Roseitalea sp.]|nr:VOC family protein [Roseitalea sp.]MBO6721005.1 VOC family protein [Roseitalea sp.]MBO6742923.1 VOC family protein [Roseitalea sp.]
MSDRPNARMCIFLKEKAAEAANFYADTIPDTFVDHVQPIGDGQNMVLFRVMGTHFMAMDGNPSFEPRPDHSISIATLDQNETDRLWDALTDGGSEGRCGWLCDQFGVHWQVVPTAMTHMLGDADREAAGRAQAAMMTMKKIDIAAMEAAFHGRG